MDVNRSPAAPPEETLYDVIRHVRPLFRHLAKAVEDRLEGTGMTVGMRAVLERLGDAGPQTVPQAARALLIPRQFAQRLVNAALALDLVRLKANPAHRRSSLVALTPAGEKAIAGIKARERAVLRDVASRMSPRDIVACLRVMAQLTDEFRRIAHVGAEEEDPR
jgi:DNA-binding MarR family transcriptional regulator